MTRFQRLICFLLAVGLVLGLYGVLALNRAIENVQFNNGGQIGYQEAPLDVDYLAERMGEEFAKQGSLFAGIKETLRAPDAERFAIVLEVTATPKEFTENTTAQLMMGEQRIAMAQKNGVFTGELLIPLDTGAGEFFIQLKDGNQYRSQAIPADAATFASGWQVFGIYGSLGEFENASESTAFHLNETLKLDETLLPFGDKPASARVYAMQDGKALFSQPMQNGVLELDHSIQLKQELPVTLYGEVKGESGLTYRYDLYQFGMDEDAQFGGPGSNLLEIIGKDSQTLQMETADF